MILPSGLVPDPVYDTDPPGLTVTLEDGFVIVAVGGWLVPMTRVTSTVWVTAPLVPRIVSG